MEIAESLRNDYQLKVRGIAGGEPSEVEEIAILNRKLAWKGNEMRYEADPEARGDDLEGRGVG